jgi:ubiquinone/menaquinone biosynthesis C-methylase UbiE
VVASDKLFAGSIPEIYDRYLVPLIFEPYAENVAARINKIGPSHVLETAAGTGVLTRAMAARLPAGARIVATDLNQPMLDYAARHAGVDRERIEWKQSDAQALPFPDQGFDVVACQFGVMFFPDKVQGYKEARRVLRPGGRFIFTVWDKISENDFADTVTQALASVFPDDPPRFLARTPHGYHDENQIRSDLESAGFADVSVDNVSATSKAASASEPAIGFCQGTPLRNELEARDPARLEDATKQAARAVADRHGSGAIEGRIRALVITAAP